MKRERQECSTISLLTIYFHVQKKTNHCVPAVWLAARQKSQPKTIRNKIINDGHYFGCLDIHTMMSMVLFFF
jgi:hypothetical protein